MNLAYALVVVALIAIVGRGQVELALATFSARHAAAVQRQTGPAVDAAVAAVTNTIAAQVGSGNLDGPFTLPTTTSIAAPTCAQQTTNLCGTGYTVDYASKGGTPGAGTGSGNARRLTSSAPRACSSIASRLTRSSPFSAPTDRRLGRDPSG